MSSSEVIPEEILLSIQNLPQESLGELVDFIEYLQYKNSLKKNRDSQTYGEQEIETEITITAAESEELIEQMLTEIGDSLPNLSDYAVSRAGIYEEHP